MHKNKTKIGGYGEIAEIDETMVYKRESNVGRLTSDEKMQVTGYLLVTLRGKFEKKVKKVNDRFLNTLKDGADKR